MASNDEKGWIGKLFEIGVTAVLAMIGWGLANMWSEIKDAKDFNRVISAETAAIRERLPLEYVRKDEYRVDIGEIRRLLERIDGKVDGKLNRSDAPSIRGGAVGPGVWRDGRDVNR